MNSHHNNVLIVGASGLVGMSAVREFHRAGWNVIALSRRKPDVNYSNNYSHISVDLLDQDECNYAVRSFKKVSHIVYAAVYEKPGLIEGWLDEDQISKNYQMIRNIIEPFSKLSTLKHVSLLQGTKAYGIHLHPMRIPAKETDPRDDHHNFYWLQEDYLKQKSKDEGINYTIFRPSIIFGESHGASMGLAQALGAYAAICRELKQPCSFPGGPSFIWEASDSRLVAKALLWSTEAATAVNQIFNVTNGDVFEWRALWPILVRVIGGELGPDNPRMIAEWMLEHSHVWDRLTKKYALRDIPLKEYLGESHYFSEFCLACGMKEPPPPAFVSTIKIRKAGFYEVQDTEEMFEFWLRKLVSQGYLPSV